MKKIVVLGVGSAQADFIRVLKKHGYYVIGMSYKREGAALHLVDEFVLINIIDKERILEFMKLNNVESIYSVGSDLAMPTIGYVNDSLGFCSFVSERIAMTMQDKFLFRSFLKQNDIESLKFVSVTDEQELNSWDIFPVMVKPVDSQGQRGVEMVSDKKSLIDAFHVAKKLSNSKRVIVEEYIEGNEISVNSYFYKGCLKYIFISDRRVVEGFTGGLVKGHDFPANITDIHRNKIRNIVEQVASALHYTDGPMYFQMKYRDNDVYIIEGTPRFDGCHLWRLIEKRYGINLLEITMEHLFEGRISHFPQCNEPSNTKDIIEFLVQTPGTIFHQDVYKKDIKDACYVELYYNEGDIVRPINGKADKVGYVIKHFEA